MSKVQCWLFANDRACLQGSQLFPFLFLSLAQYFTCNDSDPVQIWSHESRSCTAGNPGCLVLCWVTWVEGRTHLSCPVRPSDTHTRGSRRYCTWLWLQYPNHPCSEGAKSIAPALPFRLQSGSTCPRSKGNWFQQQNCPCSSGRVPSTRACTFATRRCCLWWLSAWVWAKDQEVSMCRVETWQYAHCWDAPAQTYIPWESYTMSLNVNTRYLIQNLIITILFKSYFTLYDSVK